MIRLSRFERKKDVKFQAHRGVSTENPENTIEAIRAASEQGYYSAEIDVNVTLDGQFVLLHDDTLNRTARTPDGSRLKELLSISDITYEQALCYDFGIYFSRKFKGEKIPFLWDVLEFASKVGLKLKLDCKYENFSARDKENLFALLSRYANTAELTCKTLSELEHAAAVLPFSRFHYDGEISDEALSKLNGIADSKCLTVWVENSSAAPELCKQIKEHAELGIRRLSSYSELAAAESLGADIIETCGQLKPTMNAGLLPDMHTHSNHSHDCRVPLREMRAAQEAKNTRLAAVTNHADVGFYKTREELSHLTRAFEETVMLNARNNSPCRLLTGVEIGDGVFAPEMMRCAESLCDYDVIIGSVHCAEKDGVLYAYSRTNFSEESDRDVDEFLGEYFKNLKKTVEIGDFDILAHLTCPLRYVVGRSGKKADIAKYDGIITEILKEIIKKGIALELNTSSLSLALGDFVPSTDILVKYRELGGYLITLGSDAHILTEASANFERAKKHLKALGFENVFYYKNRRAYQCKLV